MTELHVIRVFVGADGRGGNPLGVFVDGPAIAPADRQAVARELGFSETVFVDAITDGAATIRIFTPGLELPFAGHPTVGTSWLLRRLGRPVARLLVPAGPIPTWPDGELTWIRARAGWVADIHPVQFSSPAEVDALVPAEHGSTYAWAWLDEAAGLVRSRFFVADFGIYEDEATGAAAVEIGDLLGRPLTIHQGVGSELFVRPDPVARTVDVGGRVESVETRVYDGPH
jgi:predicted PhzF superfamily epimerase YddE/YHI9